VYLTIFLVVAQSYFYVYTNESMISSSAGTGCIVTAWLWDPPQKLRG